MIVIQDVKVIQVITVNNLFLLLEEEKKLNLQLQFLLNQLIKLAEKEKELSENLIEPV